MIMTCREMYVNFHHMLYTLHPLMIDISKSSKRQQRGVCSKEGLDHLIVDSDICRAIKKVNFTIYLRLLFSAKKYQVFLIDSLSKFVNLTTVTIQINSISLLDCVYKCPSKLVNLKLVVRDSGRRRWHVPQFSGTPCFQLKTFRFRTAHPIKKGRSYKVVFNSLGANAGENLTPEIILVSDEAPNKFEFAMGDKSLLAIICRFLQELLDYNRQSLEYIDLRMTNISFLFPTKLNFQFPNLKLIKVDQTSQVPVYLIRQLLAPNHAVLVIVNTLKPEIIKLTITRDNQLFRQRFSITLGIVRTTKKDLGL